MLKRLRRWRHTVREREFSDHPLGYPSQAELEASAGYAPGGVEIPRDDERRAADYDR